MKLLVPKQCEDEVDIGGHVDHLAVQRRKGDVVIVLNRGLQSPLEPCQASDELLVVTWNNLLLVLGTEKKFSLENTGQSSILPVDKSHSPTKWYPPNLLQITFRLKY